MKYHNFYMRVLCLILIIGALLGYNSMQKDDTQAQEIAELTDRVSILEDQQKEMLTALEDAAKAQEKAKSAAAENNSSQKTADNNVTADSSEEDNVYKDGTYTGEAQGFGGTIQVQVTLAGDEIADIQVTSAPGEDAAYLSQGEGVISSIISAQSTDVDTVSGATFSSTGIINAVVDALGKAENA
ncbi:MAG: FMN-binding protein [Eubacteriales bacterium]|nr:FMN-binding protein [Eubacteriales bacterium]